ncbi:MAG TPA: sigma-70 family RNA polymerase sigma factor [Gemmataceae bacterium]|jgi:RNA polymerase sigma-70 factor (ECF subfamily)|nr:sigma-70 family RNA polymerase sigma factor [Gemmataceae bacterium]
MTSRQLADLIDTQAASLVLFARQWCAAPEDVVQDAFCKLVVQKVAPADQVAWLYRVVRNAAIDAGKAARRRQRREMAAARPVQWFEEVAVDDLDVATAVAALETLPADQREVIVARLWGGMTLEEIAAVVGCSVSSAHRRFAAGITGLRERLGVLCPKT